MALKDASLRRAKAEQHAGDAGWYTAAKSFGESSKTSSITVKDRQFCGASPETHEKTTRSDGS